MCSEEANAIRSKLQSFILGVQRMAPLGGRKVAADHKVTICVAKHGCSVGDSEGERSTVIAKDFLAPSLQLSSDSRKEFGPLTLDVIPTC